MSRSRTWNLRMNLDLFNAALAALVDDAEKAQFLGGLSLGMNGGKLRPESHPPVVEGFNLGSNMRLDTESYRDAQYEKGKLGGRPKKPGGLPNGSPAGLPLVNQTLTKGEPGVNPNHNLGITDGTDVQKPPVVPQRGPAEVKVSPPKGKAAGKWEDLFSNHPEALPHFQAILNAHSKKRAIMLERKEKGIYKKWSIPILDPTPGAIAFLLLVNGGNDPLLLRAMHHCYLVQSDQVEGGFMQCLKVFFGAPGKSKKCTWEGFRDDAVRFLADLNGKGSQATPPPVPAPANPQVPVDLLASAGFAHPLPL